MAFSFYILLISRDLGLKEDKWTDGEAQLQRPQKSAPMMIKYLISGVVSSLLNMPEVLCKDVDFFPSFMCIKPVQSLQKRQMTNYPRISCLTY